VTTVSVCIANYNYARYVGGAVESCLAQGQPDLEIIVVDDGSTDDSAAVLESLGGKITFIRQENAGQFPSVRRAFEASRGDLIIFLDADDLLDPTTASRAVAALERDPEVARIQWRLRVIGPDGEETSDTFPPAGWTLPDGDLRRHILERRTYVWPPTSGNAYPRPVLDLVFSAIKEDETPLIDLILAETTPLIGPVVTLSGEGGSYRWHGGNFSENARRDLVGYLHDRVNETVDNHRIVGRVCDLLDIEGFPPDPTTALDWAFAGYRLSSLRVDPASHPLSEDTRASVTWHGIRSVLTQPNYSVTAKGKRALWFAALAVASASSVRGLIERAYLAPPTEPTFTAVSGARH
jgi:glycosyltransferase involved in cell wall biosynthesis